MKCPACNHQTIVDVKFCPSCGAKMPEPEPPAEVPVATTAEAAPVVAPPPPATTPIVTTPPTVTAPVTPPAAAAPPVAAPTYAQAPVTPPATPQYAPPTGVAPTAAPPKKGSSWWVWACGGCGCLTLLVLLVIGILAYIGAKQDGGKGGDGGPKIVVPGMDGGKEDAPPPSDDVSGGAISKDHFSLTVPSDWERKEADEPDPTDLVIAKPLDSGGQLKLLIFVTLYDSAPTLQDFSDEDVKQIEAEPDEDNPNADLLGTPARLTRYSDSDKDLLVYSMVKGNAGISVRCAAPKGKLEEYAPDFDDVLETLELR